MQQGCAGRVLQQPHQLVQLQQLQQLRQLQQLQLLQVLQMLCCSPGVRHRAAVGALSARLCRTARLHMP